MMVQDIETTEALVSVYTTRKEDEYKVLVHKYNPDCSVKKAGFSQHFKSTKHGEAFAQELGEHFGLTNAYTLNDFREV